MVWWSWWCWAVTPSVCGLLQGKAMLLVLENEMLKLLDPEERVVLHTQPIVTIRVWGVGRDSGRYVECS